MGPSVNEWGVFELFVPASINRIESKKWALNPFSTLVGKSGFCEVWTEALEVLMVEGVGPKSRMVVEAGFHFLNQLVVEIFSGSAFVFTLQAKGDLVEVCPVEIVGAKVVEDFGIGPVLGNPGP